MPNLTGSTTEPNTAVVLGENRNDTTAAGPGVHGVSKAAGVWGESTTWHGVVGFSQSTTESAGEYGKGLSDNIGAVGESTARAGVQGMSKPGPGVFGTSLGTTADTAGVFGENTNETTAAGPGVYGKSRAAGVWGLSTTWHGVYGETQSTTGGAGVCGEHTGGGHGVAGISDSGAGIFGKGRVAGLFEGDVEVTGRIGGTHCSFNGDVAVTGNVTVDRDITLTNADCAEDFDIASGATVEPGTVMVLDSKGMLKASDCAYDKQVAGVISGAGSYKPGIVFDKQSSRRDRSPVALLGKVFCKVDASDAAIEAGDLLTTSGTPGHAMKATDPIKAFGTVIGKALAHFEGDRV